MAEIKFSLLENSRDFLGYPLNAGHFHDFKD